MLKTIVIDDEPLAIELLSDYIKKTEELELLTTFSNPIKALQFVQENDIDLIFLDIQMPELTGIQMMKILNRKYQIVLTTAYNQYAVDGFEHDVADYLLKPIAYDRFLVAIQKVKQRFKPAPTVLENKPQSKEYIFVKSEYRIQKIDLKDIRYFEGLGDYVAIHTSSGKILTLEKMKHFEKTLPQQDFMRVHKSYIVAFSKIDFIERNRIFMGKALIPISDTYKKAFWERIKK